MKTVQKLLPQGLDNCSRISLGVSRGHGCDGVDRGELLLGYMNEDMFLEPRIVRPTPQQLIIASPPGSFLFPRAEGKEPGKVGDSNR